MNKYNKYFEIESQSMILNSKIIDENKSYY